MRFQTEVSIQTRFEKVLCRRKLCVQAQQKRFTMSVCVFFVCLFFKRQQQQYLSTFYYFTHEVRFNKKYIYLQNLARASNQATGFNSQKRVKRKSPIWLTAIFFPKNKLLFFLVIQQAEEEEKRTSLFIPTEKSSEEKSSFLKSESKSCQLFSLKHSNTYSPRLRSQNVNAFQEEKRN